MGQIKYSALPNKIDSADECMFANIATVILRGSGLSSVVDIFTWYLARLSELLIAQLVVKKNEMPD